MGLHRRRRSKQGPFSRLCPEVKSELDEAQLAMALHKKTIFVPVSSCNIVFARVCPCQNLLQTVWARGGRRLVSGRWPHLGSEHCHRPSGDGQRRTRATRMVSTTLHLRASTSCWSHMFAVTVTRPCSGAKG